MALRNSDGGGRAGRPEGPTTADDQTRAGQRSDAGRLGPGLPRWHHVPLALWALVWFVLIERHGGQSWHYLRLGARLLFGTDLSNGARSGGGLHLYANHPELQSGPLSFVFAGLFAYLPIRTGAFLVEACMSGIGLYILILTGRSAARLALGRGIDHRRLQARVLLAGLAFIPMWTVVSVRFAHLDDVLALLFTALAVHALTRTQSATVGVCLALAIGSKPWAVTFIPLILALPRSQWLRAGGWMIALLLATWLPFVLGDTRTLHAAQFKIDNQPASALRRLGVTDPTTPAWDRPAQAALGLSLGLLAIRRGRWPAVVLLGADARILLDPSVYTYYTASVLLGTLLWDIIASHRLIPLWSWLAFVSLYGSVFIIHAPDLRGLIRLAFVTVSSLYVLFRPIRTPTDQLDQRSDMPR